MLTKTLLALKATLSQSPETKQQSNTGTSECAGSISSRSVVVHDVLGEGAVGAEASSDKDGRVLKPGVLKGVSLVAEFAVAMAPNRMACLVAVVNGACRKQKGKKGTKK